MKRRSAKRCHRDAGCAARPCEWLGGQLPTHFSVEDERGGTFLPDMILWTEQPSGVVVGHELCAPDEADRMLSRTLLAAMRAPAAGAPREPDRIRVAAPELAAEPRSALGECIPVGVAATPELDELLDALAESSRPDGPDEQASYLAGGRVSPQARGALSAVAERLYRLAPWQRVTDGQILRVDIPAFDVNGGCLSIIGNLGESLGLLLFPSLEAFEAFAEAAEQATRERRPDFGTVPAGSRSSSSAAPSSPRGCAVRSMSTAGPWSTPRPTRRSPGGVATAAWARSRSVTCEWPQPARARSAPSSSSMARPSRTTTRIRFASPTATTRTARSASPTPTRPWPLFEVIAPPQPHPSAHARGSKVGRNDPCPCGSSRK